jgi:hypothetical protein
MHNLAQQKENEEILSSKSILTLSSSADQKLLARLVVNSSHKINFSYAPASGSQL